ncbi:uncharacterized protein LKV04_005918 [Tautogolabrus adspersus]
MPAVSPPASLLCVLLCVSVTLQRSDMRLAYVTHNTFSYYSCSQDPQPCSISSLTDCRCKDMLSTLHRPHSHSSPVFSMKRLTVWFTSPVNTARLLNNSEVRHLTLIHCGVGGSREAFSLEGHFTVKLLERLTVVNLLQRPDQNIPDANKAKSRDSTSDPERDNSAHLDINRYNRDTDTNLDLILDMKRDYSAFYSPQIQDLFLGRELGATCHEQARLGVIHSAVLEWGAAVKAYTVQTHINKDGVLPFPDLQMPKLEETSVIYVSFVY